MDATAIKGRGYYNESLRKADYRAAQVLSAEHFYELCRSFNFSVALGADSRVGGWRPLSERPPKAWHDEVQSRFIYFANILSPNSSGTRRVLPFFDLELGVEPSSSFDKSALLEARQLFLGGYHPRAKVVPLSAYRYPFLASFLLAKTSSLVLYFSCRPNDGRRERILFFGEPKSTILRQIKFIGHMKISMTCKIVGIILQQFRSSAIL